jgi:ATPase family associated with various cellular activities (AAA)/Winged helix domain, variant
MTASAAWVDANQRHLTAALAEVRSALERHLGEAGDSQGLATSAASGWDLPDAAAGAPALDEVCGAFGLSPFERLVLVLAAAPELDGRFPALCAAAQGDPGRAYPTFGLALAALPGGHWSALTPGGPLRRWRLVEVAGSSPTGAPLRVDERVLHFLTGAGEHDGDLGGMLEPVPAEPDLPPSQRRVADRLAELWRLPPSPPVPQLVGRAGTAKPALAAAAAAELGARLSRLDGRLLPADPGELDRLARLLEREAVLGRTALLIDAEDSEEPERLTAVTALAGRLAAPVALATRDRLPVKGRGTVGLEVGRPTPAEQRDLWLRMVGPDEPVDLLVGQFDLDPAAIRGAVVSAGGGPAGLWEACRAQARPRLGALAQRIEPAARWDELVLPPPQRGALAQLAVHVRHRLTVYETWGLRRGRTRGLGTTALFAGPSGTGKTLAAEVLAADLDLDLYRVDLSAVVSKYIGETEKNLRQVFDAAEDGGAVLLFDEADALFGKRGEIRDSHDRYANIEIAYLLQHMEEYRGLAVLTTNLGDALDAAFMRRLRFVIEFPFPDATLRAEIWRRVFPTETPTAGIDAERLARINVAGGSIRNIAVGAAFMAAGDGGVVRMDHVLAAARGECAKLEQPLPDLGVRP